MKNINIKMLGSTLFMFAVLCMSCSSMASPLDLANEKDCFSCHSMDDKTIGPAYKDVAAKYAGKQGAKAMLVNKVMHGGSGTWGNIRMPANTQVNEAEARILVEWVLSQNQTVSVLPYSESAR